MQTLANQLNILFVYLSLPRVGRPEMEQDVTELWHLVETMGNAAVVDLIHQKGPEFDATYIGPGKAAEVGEYLTTHPIDIIIFNGKLKPGQKFNLLKLYYPVNPHIRIWDRVDLILEIFSRHARTAEAKLQIAIARMESMGPRIFGMGMVLSRQGGGIGTRGIGETNTELMHRHWKREIARAHKELAKLSENRERQIEHRKNLGLKTISIVGYTNAGKTALFNHLTRKKHPVENALFATLDSTVGEIYMPELGGKVLISDTIGFIANLPPTLIDAFKSTLMESVYADTVLHVIDVSDPQVAEKIEVVGEILDTLKIPKEKEVMVFNKIDLMPNPDKEMITKYADTRPYVYISAKTGQGIDKLTKEILPAKIGVTS